MKNIDDYKKVTDRLELKRDCLTEAVNMIEQKSEKKHRFSKRRIIPVLAAAVVSCCAVTAVFADDIANVFRKAENKQQMTAEGADGEQYKVDKSDQLNYKEIENHAVSLSAEAEADGLKIKAENSFCDGENMTVMFTAENTNPDIENSHHIWVKGVTVEINGNVYSSTETYSEIWVEMICDYEGASTYTGTLQFPIPEDCRFTETTDVRIHAGLFEMADVWENDGVSFKSGADFLISVTPDTSANRINAEKLVDGDIEVAEVKSTPYALSVKYKVPIDSSYVLMVYDENGDRLDYNLENQGSYDGEYATNNFTATDSKMVTLKFVDKNSEDLEVASTFNVEL